MNIHGSLVTEAQRFATVYDVDVNFPVHRARRPPRHYDEKTEKRTVNVDLSRTASCWSLLYSTGYGCLSTRGSNGSRKFIRWHMGVRRKIVEASITSTILSYQQL